MCDLSRAFECLNHAILLGKLRHYRFNEQSVKLLKSYLENRPQIVKIGDKHSDPCLLNTGIPTGSILGPLIFLLYINDLPVNLPDYARTTIFADDTTLFVEGSNQDDLIGRGEIVLAQAQVWFNANRLHLNQSKTQHIVISLSTANTFENPDSVDLLGFRIDPQLKWHAHIDKVAKKVSSRIFLLRRLQTQVSREALKNAYYGLVHSILTYGILLWGHSTSVPQLFILQKKAVRIVSGAQYLEHAKPLFIQLGILTLPSLFILQCLLHTKKNIAEFPNFEAAHSYDTRNKNNLVPFHHRVYAARNGTNYHGISFYNKLPLSIRDLPLPSFKRFIENYLKSKAFYSTEEFLLTDSDSICLPTDI
ncbi:hypothetical protein M8J77_000574 [Diaphorina citri]|nr:hypothetical protein M8J77_000574 [Diaphorina citri]